MPRACFLLYTIVDSSFNGTIAYGETSPGTVNITRLSDGTEIPAGTVVKVNISQVKNIPHSGDVGDYNVSTKQSDGTFIDFTDEVSNEPIFVPATLVGGSVAVANNSKAKAGQEGTLHFRITLSSNPLPANGKIRIGLPTGYCKNVQGLDDDSICGDLAVTGIEGMDGGMDLIGNRRPGECDSTVTIEMVRSQYGAVATW